MHSYVTSKNVKWFHLIWPTLYIYTYIYLSYGADVKNWNNLDLSSIRHAFNSTMCKVYKVKFQLLDSIYDFTNQRDIVQDIYHIAQAFWTETASNNSVIKHVLAISSVGLSWDSCYVFTCVCQLNSTQSIFIAVTVRLQLQLQYMYKRSTK